MRGGDFPVGPLARWMRTKGGGGGGGGAFPLALGPLTRGMRTGMG